VTFCRSENVFGSDQWKISQLELTLKIEVDVEVERQNNDGIEGLAGVVVDVVVDDEGDGLEVVSVSPSDSTFDQESYNYSQLQLVKRTVLQL